ncbi:MAG: ABC transporter ATP-binding protein [Clostridiales Family XIII bacterium]|jgi:peptide/nickel transport system ATP-binding protein|nr:ABC transporter ATP-binding protein [Clostridiales Family XIII bacterium]
MNQTYIKNLKVDIASNEILHGIDLDILAGHTIGIVGESGSGKSILSKTLTGLLPDFSTASGEYVLEGENRNLNASDKEWYDVRGTNITLILQDPFTALDSMRKIKSQILDGVRKSDRADFDVISALSEVGLDENVANSYPGELSGGMRQRVVIASALATNPDILIADESTTALDTITQKEVLDLLARIKESRHMTIILISHDLPLIAERADYIVVMNDGQIVERGDADEIMHHPQHAYTQKLIHANKLNIRNSFLESNENTILTVTNLSKSFGEKQALHDVSIQAKRGEIIGIVGESGSGKTTLARTIVGLTKADGGTIELNEKTCGFPQIVFQDPYSSLNSALKIRTILAEAIRAGEKVNAKCGKIGEIIEDHNVEKLMDMVDLPHHYLNRRPGSLSGGERQRIAIARAIATNPSILICDESVASLDASVRAQILEMLYDMREKLSLTILFITHDLSVVREIADRAYVMNHGQIVEEGSTDMILNHPRHPYTQKLVEAAPSLIA